jgi:hypothetical protein
LEHVPALKEMKQAIQDKVLNARGFLGYPVLQAVDIVIHKADTIDKEMDKKWVEYEKVQVDAMEEARDGQGRAFPDEGVFLDDEVVIDIECEIYVGLCILRRTHHMILQNWAV